MDQKLLKRFILGSGVLVVVIPAGLVHRQYQHDMSLAYQRTSSGGKMVETACGTIYYNEFGDGAPICDQSVTNLCW